MFALLRNTSARDLLLQQLPAIALSLVVAELFYKLGSFALECLAFLATWLVIDLLFHGLRRLMPSPSAKGRTSAGATRDDRG